jgi:hypothetical protein
LQRSSGFGSSEINRIQKLVEDNREEKEETMNKQRVKQKFPPGWNEPQVRRVLDYYESQTDEEAATEIRSALENTTMEVPTDLVPAVRQLIAKRKSSRARATKRRNTRPRAASRARGAADKVSHGTAY